MKKKFKERKPIEVVIQVETKKAGYSLDVNGQGYMYFDKSNSTRHCQHKNKKSIAGF